MGESGQFPHSPPPGCSEAAQTGRRSSGWEGMRHPWLENAQGWPQQALPRQPWGVCGAGGALSPVQGAQLEDPLHLQRPSSHAFGLELGSGTHLG